MSIRAVTLVLLLVGACGGTSDDKRIITLTPNTLEVHALELWDPSATQTCRCTIDGQTRTYAKTRYDVLYPAPDIPDEVPVALTESWSTCGDYGWDCDVKEDPNCATGISFDLPGVHSMAYTTKPCSSDADCPCSPHGCLSAIEQASGQWTTACGPPSWLAGYTATSGAARSADGNPEAIPTSLLSSEPGYVYYPISCFSCGSYVSMPTSSVFYYPTYERFPTRYATRHNPPRLIGGDTYYWDPWEQAYATPWRSTGRTFYERLTPRYTSTTYFDTRPRYQSPRPLVPVPSLSRFKSSGWVARSPTSSRWSTSAGNTTYSYSGFDFMPNSSGGNWSSSASDTQYNYPELDFVAPISLQQAGQCACD